MPPRLDPAIMAADASERVTFLRNTLALTLVSGLLCAQGGSAIAGELGRSAETPGARLPSLAAPAPAAGLEAASLADPVLGLVAPAAIGAAEAPAAPAAAQTAAPATAAAAAARTANSAPDKRESASAGESEASRQNGLFDGALGSLSPDQVPVLLVAPGRAPERSTLAQARSLIEERGLTSAFAAEGHFRLVIGDQANGGLTEDQLQPMLGLLRSHGLSPDESRARVERVMIKAPETPTPSAPAPATPAKSSLPRALARLAVGAAAGAAAFAAFGDTYPLGAAMLAGFASVADRFVVETRYSWRLFRSALRESRRPTWKEVGGGFVGKIAPGILNAFTFWAMYNASGPHHVGAAVAIALSLAVETFHGVWADTWNNLQAKLSAYRGAMYQGLFNFVYGGLIGASYRLVAFITLGMAPPWTGEYWGPMLAMMVIGTFVSTLGYRGLNGLYEKGEITRWGRSGRQYFRDIFMMITGPLFGTGYLALTALAFTIQQCVDLYFFYRNKRTATKPILYVADPAVADSQEFDRAFVHPIDPLKQAVATVADNPLGRLAVAGYRALKRVFGK